MSLLEKREVISRKNLPTRLPLWFTVVALFILKEQDAAGWIWGMAITLLVLLWICAILSVFTEINVDVFEGEEEEEEEIQ